MRAQASPWLKARDLELLSKARRPAGCPSCAVCTPDRPIFLSGQGRPRAGWADPSGRVDHRHYSVIDLMKGRNSVLIYTRIINLALIGLSF